MLIKAEKPCLKGCYFVYLQSKRADKNLSAFLESGGYNLLAGRAGEII